MMTKKNYLVAALIGLLVCLTVAWKQDTPTPEYRDVLRGLVGQEVDYTSPDDRGVVWLYHPSDGKYGQGALTVSAVGTDFVELTAQGGVKLYSPIGQVILRVTPAK